MTITNDLITFVDDLIERNGASDADEARWAALKPAPGLETPRMLVLSTSHITLETNTMFAFSTDDVPQFFPKAPWGAPDDNLGWIIPLVEGEPFPHTCPGDLLSIHLLAIQHGCTWIMLDRDGPVVASLPTYDW